MNTPNPFVSAYAVRELKYSLSPTGVVTLEWATRNPVVVNTVDIEATLRQPNVFLWSWQETHYEMRHEQMHGTIVPRYAERLVTREHTINQKILAHLSLQYQQLGTVDVTKTAPPRYRSFEKILFDLGWMWHFEPVAAADDVGCVVPPKLAERLRDEPEVQACFPDELKLSENFDISPEPVEAVDISSAPKIDRIERLELMVGQLAQTLTTVVEALRATNHSPGSHQPYPVGAEREND